MAVRGRSEPIKPHYGYPPFVLTYPPPPAGPPVGKVVYVRAKVDDRERGARARVGKVIRGRYPPFVYPNANGYVDVSDSLVYGLTITDELKFGLEITDSRLDGVTPMAYDIGDVVKLQSVTFTNEAGTATDPTTVLLEIEFPDGSERQLTYAAGELTRVSAGRFRYDHTITQAGRHTYRYAGTGTVVAAEEAAFVVKSSVF